MDPELLALHEICSALERVPDTETRARVLRYIFEKYRSTISSTPFALLAAPSVTQLMQPNVEELDERTLVTPTPDTSRVAMPKSKAPQRKRSGTSRTSSPEVLALVNWLKNSEIFETFESSVLDKGRDNISKLLGILRVYELVSPDGVGIGASDIAAFYHQFQIKLEPSNIRRSLRGEAGLFLSDNGKYKLSRTGQKKADDLLAKRVSS